MTHQKVLKSSVEFYHENPRKTMSYLELYSLIQGVICIVRKLAVKATILPYSLETKIDPIVGHMIKKNTFKSHIGQNNFMNPFLPIYIEETTKP